MSKNKHKVSNFEEQEVTPEVMVESGVVPPAMVDAAVPEVTTEAQTMDGLKKTTEMQFTALVELVGIHTEAYLTQMTAPRMSQGQRYQAIKNYSKALKAVLRFGLNKGNDFPNSGHGAKEAVTFAGIMAQAIDVRMVKLAQKMQEDENKEVKND